MLEPRLRVPDEFGLSRYLAAGLAALQTVDPKLRIDLASLADELDAEALRNSAGREVFTNPAKALAARVSGCQLALVETMPRRWRWPGMEFGHAADRKPGCGRYQAFGCGCGATCRDAAGCAVP